MIASGVNNGNISFINFSDMILPSPSLCIYLFNSLQSSCVPVANTVDMEKFTGLNFCSFHLTKVFAETLVVSLARSACYLREALMFMENLRGALKNCKCLAQ